MNTSTSAQKLNFSSFKASFSSNVVALKRRFSSGDLENEYEDQAKEVLANKPVSPGGSIATEIAPPPPPPQPQNVLNNATKEAIKAGPPPPTSKTTSAPTSPSRSTSSSSIFQRLQSVTGVAREVTSNITSQVIANVSGAGANTNITPTKIPYKDPNSLIILVIDEPNTDWSKYFKGKKMGQFEIGVEQCEFSELSVVSFEGQTIVSYIQYASGMGRQLRQFIPDFLLIRQNLRDAGRDYKNMLLAFMYGGLYSVNSLAAIYNFQDKPWVFAHMLGIQRKINGFPLIEQNFYPDFKNMSGFVPKLPAVLKIGHAHGGLGKIRVPNHNDYQDASSVVAVTGTYCTSEPYVEARCDVHIQKIGNQYKAFMRKGIVGHWKSGSGSAMLEQIQMNERYRTWVDNVATLFGGLDICALEVLVGKDGREWIIEVNDSALSLMGETQEEDRRHISELVLSRMAVVCKTPLGIQQNRYRRQSASSSSNAVNSTDNIEPSNEASNIRRDSQGSGTTVSSKEVPVGKFSRQNSQVTSSSSTEQPQSTTGETEDTMKNLRKTFAGIFGDM